MNTFDFVAHGFRTARRHPRLVMIVWLAPLIPALILVTLIASNIGPALGRSLFSQGILDGSAFPVFMEFRSSPADALEPLMGKGALVMGVLSLLLQIFLSAGIVGVLAGSGPPNPFLTGVRRNTCRFLRSALVFLVPTAVAAVAAGLTVKGGGLLATHFADGRWDLAGIGAAAVFFLILWAPADLAYDLSRIAAVRHDHRSMLRGFFRALLVVLKKPGTFVPLYLVFLALPLLLLGLYSAFRQPWTPGTAFAVVLLALIHQIVMAIRAFFKIGFWAAEVEVFRNLEEPELSRGKQRVVPDPVQPDPPTPDENSLESIFLTPEPD
ncbi:MAG: hypothetical protein DRJ65_20830 [Acidobacteria bacterium]|nr:MAG: hypothetical protein DRJ65_20830 [Acidobacteriota bacterium]